MLIYTSSSSLFVSPLFYILIAIIVSAIIARTINIKRAKDPSRVKITSIRGKLIRKTTDENDEIRNVRNIRRNYYGMHKLNEGLLKRYYITFETHKGIKSFTVSKEVYNKVKVHQQGIIKMNRKKFVAFNKDSFY